jgi:hypothetical protein
MNKKELLEKLKGFNNKGDVEANHAEADKALLDFITDEEIRTAYNKIDKWYA